MPEQTETPKLSLADEILSEHVEFPDAEESCVTENPCCDKDAAGRPCINDAGHELDCIPMPLSQAEKIDYMFAKFQDLETLVEQAGPLLEQAGPLLATFGGQASSPLGRIAGSFLRG